MTSSSKSKPSLSMTELKRATAATPKILTKNGKTPITPQQQKKGPTSRVGTLCLRMGVVASDRVVEEEKELDIDELETVASEEIIEEEEFHDVEEGA